MKKFKLLKDLPKYKAGTEFRLTAKGHLASGDTMVYHKKDLERFPNILKDWFEEIPEQPKTVWDLNPGDKCWMFFLSEFGYVPQQIEFGKLAVQLRLTGSLFLTKEEGKKDLAWSRAREILKRDTKGFKPDWEGKTDRHYGWNVIYNPTTYKLFANIDYNHLNDGTLRFAAKEDAEASIKVHEKEWKIYLGVEE